MIKFGVDLDDREFEEVIERSKDRRRALRLIGEYMMTVTRRHFLTATDPEMKPWPELSPKTLARYSAESPKTARLAKSWKMGRRGPVTSAKAYRNQRLGAVSAGFRVAQTPLLASGKMYGSIRPIYHDPVVDVEVSRTGNQGADVADIHQEGRGHNPVRRMVGMNQEEWNSVDAIIEDFLQHG